MTALVSTDNNRIIDDAIKQRQRIGVHGKRNMSGRPKGSKNGQSTLTDDSRCKQCRKKVTEFDITTIYSRRDESVVLKICNECYDRRNPLSTFGSTDNSSSRMLFYNRWGY